MKTIDTLVSDIEGLLIDGIYNVSDDIIRAFGERMGVTLSSRILAEEREKRIPGLRMSSMGKPLRQLWYEINKSEHKESLDASTHLKFLYGDLIEEFVLFLAELSGHTVEGRQDTLSIAGILGHRDCVIDGVLLDVKSASTYSFNKFKQHLRADQDSFGYLTQLQSYLHASQLDPIVRNKSQGGFLVIDKTLGHICLDIHDYIPYDWEAEYEQRKLVVASTTVPERCYEPVPEGKSGNYKLGVECSYCPFKNLCYPNLRTFLYSTGPVYLTKVVREPNVYEVTK